MHLEDPSSLPGECYFLGVNCNHDMVEDAVVELGIHQLVYILEVVHDIHWEV